MGENELRLKEKETGAQIDLHSPPAWRRRENYGFVEYEDS